MFNMLPPLVLVLMVAHGAYGKHFRGGSMSWKSIDNGNQVEVKYSLGFTFTNENPGHCTASNWAQQSVIHMDKPLVCQSCEFDQRSRTIDWICTDYDEDEDWSSGGYTINYRVPSGQQVFEIKYEDCCWVSIVSPNNGKGDTYWNMLTEVNVTPRSDGTINNSPVSAPIPYEKYYRGTVYYINVPVTDPDGDLYKCDYFEAHECSYAGTSGYPSKTCVPPTSGLTVHKNCTLVFNTAGVAAGNHAVNIMIKDCPDKACDNPYSKVPLLFLLQVTDEEGAKPLIMPIPPPCHTLRLGEHFEMVVVAEAGDESKPISKIVSYNKPFGMKESELKLVSGNNLRKYITLSWTPNTIGEQSVCVSARDSDDYTSGASCTFLNVEADPLEPDPVNSIPAANSDNIKDGDTWIVEFNKKIRRPTTSAQITILGPLGDTTFEIDATDPSVVFYNRRFEFVPSKLQTGTQTLVLDPGVAMPKKGGGCGSMPASWTFESVAGMVTISPPIATMIPGPPVYNCKEKTLEIPVENGKEGDECFIHMKEAGVVVAGPGGVLKPSLIVCCPGTCDPYGPPGYAPA